MRTLPSEVAHGSGGAESIATAGDAYDWLLSPFGSETWIVSDIRPGSTVEIKFEALIGVGKRLTDPEYAHLLTTIREVVAHARTGPFATIDSGHTQAKIARKLILLVQWMTLRNIDRFDQLTIQDFLDYRDASVLGTANLLNAPERIRSAAEALQRAGSLPTAGSGSNTRLNRSSILETAGLNPSYCTPEMARELDIISRASGLYMVPASASAAGYEPLPFTRKSAAGIRALLHSWSYLWDLRRYLTEDRLTFNPFATQSAVKMAAARAAEAGRTPTIPVDRAMPIIDMSLRWVLDYADDLLNLRDQLLGAGAGFESSGYARTKYLASLRALATNFRPTSHGPGQPWPLHPTLKPVAGGLDLNTAINYYLPAACMIVICTFSARRHEEVAGLCSGVDKPVISGELGERWLHVWIEKTLLDWDKIPVPEAVARAVAVLERWSLPARELTKTEELFQYPRFIPGETASFRGQVSVPAFAAFLPIPDGKSGPWHLTPHQLRRFFAMVYLWRYEYGELSALSWMLRHFNLEMTRLYATEAERGAIFSEVQAHHSFTILTEIAMRDRPAGGAFGVRFRAAIDRQVAQIRKRVEVVLPSRLPSKLAEHTRRTGTPMRPTSWGFSASGAAALDQDPRDEADGLSLPSAAVDESAEHHSDVVVSADGDARIVNHHRERVERLVRTFIRRMKLRLRPLAWGYCACGSTRAQTALAECRRGTEDPDALGPDEARASLDVCANCPFLATSPCFASVWRDGIAALETTAANPLAGPIIESASRARLHVIRPFAATQVFTSSV